MATPMENNTQALQDILNSVQNLPVVHEVKRVEGSCTGNDVDGYVNVNLGFKPDIIIFRNFVYTSAGGYTVANSVIMWFTEMPECEYYEVIGALYGEMPFLIYLEQTEDGFCISYMWAEYYNEDQKKYGWYIWPGQTLDYTAIKYTP